MPRRSKGPRLYLRERAGRPALWVIRDGDHEQSTGCIEGDAEGSQTAFADYLSSKYEAPRTNGRLDKTAITDVLMVYGKERAPLTRDGGAWIGYMCDPLEKWWGDKTLANVNATSCAKYLVWRLPQGVTDQTARHELKTLRAAINYYNGSEHGPLLAMPVVTLPAKKPPREDYHLTRKQAADRIRAARKLGRRYDHIIRLIIIGYYSGTRPGATKDLRWLPSPHGGWSDLESETLYRRGAGTAESMKRAPKARIHTRLLPWLRRWKAADAKIGCTHVINFYGKAIDRTDNAWRTVRLAAGHPRDGAHIMRHTAATWLMQSGVSYHEAAGFLGMSAKTLEDVYGHHSPFFQGAAASATGKRTAPGITRLRMNANATNQED